MNLRIQACNSNKELRRLLIEVADQLTGSDSQVLEPRLPWDGNPIFLADAHQRPVLISFDPECAQTALIKGLQAAEQLATALPWVNQVYAALGKQQRPPKLVVVCRVPPPGAAAILAACPNLSLFCYKVFNIDGDAGVWLEPVQAAPEAFGEPAPAQPADPLPAENLPPLSEAEKAYFQQL